MDDESLMPFGKFKGRQMIDVPASYLMWLHDNGSSVVRSAYPGVFEYIKDNMQAIEQEIIPKDY